MQESLACSDVQENPMSVLEGNPLRNHDDEKSTRHDLQEIDGEYNSSDHEKPSDRDQFCEENENKETDDVMPGHPISPDHPANDDVEARSRPRESGENSNGLHQHHADPTAPDPPVPHNHSENSHSASPNKENDTRFNFDGSTSHASAEHSWKHTADDQLQKPNLDHLRHLIADLGKQIPVGVESNAQVSGLNDLKTVLARSNDDPNIKAGGQMTSLQRAYYALQHHQMLQVQLIQKIQVQLSLANKEKVEDSREQNLKHRELESECDPNTAGVKKPTENVLKDLLEKFKPENELHTPEGSLSSLNKNDPMDRPLSPTSKSVPQTYGVSELPLGSGQPTGGESSSLEKLQQTANHVLTKASQGIFTHHLIQDANNTDGRDGSHKHKCRYCGKVFGSDSGLQIHLRSHTGERPFKCNICGNRFTTRGNLKVHFQRHQSRFPHVKMNHNPVPEHLDKLCPPLLAQLGELEDTPPAPTGPPNPFPLPTSTPQAPPPAPQYNLSPAAPLSLQQPLAASLLYRRMMEGNEPLNQRFAQILRRSEEISPSSSSITESPSRFENALSDEKRNERSATEASYDSDSDGQRSVLNKSADDEVFDQPSSEKEFDDPKDYLEDDLNGTYDGDFSNDGSSSPGSHASDSQINKELLNFLQRRQRDAPLTAFPGMNIPQNLSIFAALGRRQIEGQDGSPVEAGLDLTKDPNLYTNFLPRPGCNDNSWEALIEVQKASETMKLEQLVNNIENKLTDPNQCVICHRVLSCKSALQMHYRIHTGERPYKCKICCRTFTTKGNLKTHMSVHRARPPMRMVHQCPVCHKRYNNAMILQQHIRQHTGEPIDISMEQIAAAEVQDSIPSALHPLLFSALPNYPQLPHLLPLVQQLRPNFPSNEDNEEQNGTHQADAKHPGEEQSIKAENSDGNQLMSPSRSHSPRPLDFSSRSSLRDAAADLRASSPEKTQNNDGAFPPPPKSPQIHSKKDDSSMPIDVSLRPPPQHFFSPFSLFAPPLLPSPLNSALHLDKQRFLPGLVNIPGHGNTTCKICFKTLSCASALEIHYRSHSKDRPFVCTVCDRRFTTRGNMRQHMVTHKGHEDGNIPASSNSKSSRPRTPRNPSKTSVSLPATSPLAANCMQLRTSSPSSTVGGLPGMPLGSALFSYPRFASPLTALPGSIAALLGHASASQDLSHRNHLGKMDLLNNLKRERDGENPLPLSKRISGADAGGGESNPSDLTSIVPCSSAAAGSPLDRREQAENDSSRTLHSPTPVPTCLPHASTSSHSISQLLTQPHNPPSPPSQPLLVTT